MVKELGCGLLTVIGVVALVLVIAIGSWGFRVLTAEIKGEGDAHIQIQSANSRIPRYEHFYDLCASVQTAETGIDAETERLDNATNERTRNEASANLSALQITRMNGINQYNADAAKYKTDGQFLGYNLPTQLSTEPYEAGGTKTTCAS